MNRLTPHRRDGNPAFPSWHRRFSLTTPSLAISVGRSGDRAYGSIRIGRHGRYRSLRPGYSHGSYSWFRTYRDPFYRDSYYYDPGRWSYWGYRSPYWNTWSYTYPYGLRSSFFYPVDYAAWYRPVYQGYSVGTVYTGSTLYVDANRRYEPVEAADALDSAAAPAYPTVVDDTPPLRPLSFVEQGNASLFAGDYDEARRLYIRGVLADDKDGVTVILYGLANFALGDYRVAGDAFRRALTLDPSFIEYPPDLRSLYSDPEAFETQLRELEYYLELRGREPELRFLLAYLYYCVERQAEAHPIFVGLAEADPDDVLSSLLKDAMVRAMDPYEEPVP